MTEPVCQLDDFHFLRLAVEWHDPEVAGQINVSHSFDYSVGRHKTEKNRYRLAFRFQAIPDTPQPAGYVIRAEIVGFFSFPKETEPQKMEALVRLNGCTILYGILRGQIANVTGVFPQRKLVLPTFMMKDIVENVERAKASKSAVKKGVAVPQKEPPKKTKL